MDDEVRSVLHSWAALDGTGLMAGDAAWSRRVVVTEAARRAAAVRDLLPDGGPPHVGLLAGNTPEMLLALLGGPLGGYVPVGLNATRRGTALARDVRVADCGLVLADAAHAAALAGLDLGGVRVVELDGPAWAASVDAATPLGDVPRPDPDAPFMLIFTSGTSGAPKAVRVSHRMVVNSGRHIAGRFGIGPDDVCYQSMPMFHSNAVIAGLAVALCSGAAFALARFSASGLLPDLRRYGATYLNYVGKPLAYVLRTPRRPDDADNPLRVAFGNEAADRDIAEFAQRFEAPRAR